MRLHHLNFLNVSDANQITKGKNYTNKRRKMLKCSTFWLVFGQYWVVEAWKHMQGINCKNYDMSSRV